MNRILALITVASFSFTATYAGGNIGICKGCHGQNFEKKAMGKSKVVKDMSKEEIIAALKGYKAKTYGREMKGIMQNQVLKLSIEDIENLAAKIKK